MTDRVGLPFAAWAEADRDMWNRLVRPAGLFDEQGTLEDLSATSLRGLRATYGYYLGYLVADGVDLDAEPLSQWISPERLRGWVLANQCRVGLSSQSVYAARLLTVLRAGFPDADVQLLEIAGRKLAQRAKHEQRHDIVPDLPEATTLIQLGRDLIARAKGAGSCDSIAAAELWRDGVMILLLIHHPIRARNLTGLVLGRTLLKTTDGYRISIPGNETKTGKPIDIQVSAEISEVLTQYISEIMPVFQAPPEGPGHLWRTRRGTALAAKGLGRRIGDVTEGALGVRVSPHDFREIAANTAVIADGTHPTDPSALLGHADPRITRRHYITAGSLDVSRRHARLVETMMQEQHHRGRKRRGTG